MKVPNATSITTGTPPISKIGTTSDGRGVNSILFLANNLYLAEIGGAGLSVIPDPQGISRVACNSTSPCRASTVTPTFSFFPGGLATDGTNLFVGDSPLTTPGSILRWNPSTGALSTYSVNVPAYVSNYDNQTRNQYVNPFSLGFLPNGDLMVGDDFSACWSWRCLLPNKDISGVWLRPQPRQLSPVSRPTTVLRPEERCLPLLAAGLTLLPEQRRFT